jgi:ATP-dependent helicase/nuclease subunit A
MTIHAAKGLEAPIVFMPDTTTKGGGARSPQWLAFPDADDEAPPLRVWASKKDEDSPPVRAARVAADTAAEGEHRRLLYVAMTRAAQRLIVCGSQGEKGRAQDCWYDLIRAGLEPALEPAPAPWSAAETIWRFADTRPSGDVEATRGGSAAAEPPAWLKTPAPTERAAATLAPSSVRAAPSGPSGDDRREALAAGRLAHLALQKLAEVASEARAAAAEKFIAAQGRGLPPALRSALAERVLRLIADPELAPFFGPNSRAEVAISGSLKRRDAAALVVSGRIDRLAVHEDHVDVVDFKTGRGARKTYVEQLALYRAALQPIYKRPIKAWIVWLDSGVREEISLADLDAALNAPLKSNAAAP